MCPAFLDNISRQHYNRKPSTIPYGRGALLFETAWLLEKEIAPFDANSKSSVWSSDTMGHWGARMECTLKGGSETHGCKTPIKPLTKHYLIGLTLIPVENCYRSLSERDPKTWPVRWHMWSLCHKQQGEDKDQLFPCVHDSKWLFLSTVGCLMCGGSGWNVWSMLVAWCSSGVHIWLALWNDTALSNRSDMFDL